VDLVSPSIETVEKVEAPSTSSPTAFEEKPTTEATTLGKLIQAAFSILPSSVSVQ